jgi:hypothetical protein
MSKGEKQIYKIGQAKGIKSWESNASSFISETKINTNYLPNFHLHEAYDQHAKE